MGPHPYQCGYSQLNHKEYAWDRILTNMDFLEIGLAKGVSLNSGDRKEEIIPPT